MLRAYGEAIDVHWNRYHNFIPTIIPIWWSGSSNPVRRQTGLHPFPLGSSILKPYFHLQLMSVILNNVPIPHQPVLTWTSLNFRLVAIWLRSVRLRYFFAWNSRSSSSNCSDVNAVRLLRDFEFEPPPPDLPLNSPLPAFGEFPMSSSSVHSESVSHSSVGEWERFS